MTLRLNNKKIIIFFFLLVSIIILIFYDNKINKENIESLRNSPVVEEVIQRSGNTSRVTFFHSLPNIGSLAIPEEWEGKYRIKEEGNIAIFYYIGEPEKILPIFSVETYSKQEWEDKKNKNKNKEIIKSQDDNMYVYSLNNNYPQAGEKAKEFQEMQKEIPKILESFKVFSL